MTFLKIIGALIVAFFIEEPIIDALAEAICQTGGAFWCLFVHAISLVALFSLIYWIINKIFPAQ